MSDKTVYILWDESHIWGLMTLRAARAFALPYRLVKSQEIAQRGLLGKRSRPAVLIAPGGNARQKATALGPDGRAALRAWVADGGFYIGFCGGAGLALADEGMCKLCPWPRAPYRKRLHHLLTGHVLGRLGNGEVLRLPVWWPGRFAPGGGNVRVLASYAGSGPDLWLADLPLSRLPEKVLSVWRRELAFTPEVDFAPHLPIAVHGGFGKGGYLLSYAHLETPDSPDANSWLSSLLDSLAGIKTSQDAVPPWDTSARLANEKNPLVSAHSAMADLMDMAEDSRIFFKRTPWLRGWRSGISGMACNNLLAALSIAAALAPSDAALRLWEKKKAQFMDMLNIFIAESQELFWTTRLKGTLEPHTPEKLDQRLAEANARLLGHPMLGGAMARQLLDIVEEFIFLSENE